MSDTPYSGSSGKFNPQPGGAAERPLVQEAREVASDLKQQASRVAEHATEQVKAKASELTESAKGLATDATEKMRTAVEDQKNAGADFVSGLAGAVRRAAAEFDDQIPEAGQYIRRAAEQIDSASEALRRRDLGQLVGEMQNFARRQPTVFLGAALLAGFAAIRFVKSSTGSQTSSDTGRTSMGTGPVSGHGFSPLPPPPRPYGPTGSTGMDRRL